MKTRINRLFIPAVLVVAMLPMRVFAGDYAILNFIGFSGNGDYLAFEEYGSEDGSEVLYSHIYFVDVTKNTYAAAPVIKRVKEISRGEEAVRAQAKQAASANLKKFAIVNGNTGNLVVARLPTDLSLERPDPGSDEDNQAISFTANRRSINVIDKYELRLTTTEVKPKNCSGSGQVELKFALSITDVEGKTEKFLQRDTMLPSSRGCSTHYSIQNVYIYGNRIAVFLNNYSVGWEDPDMRYLVVTGNYQDAK